MIENDKVVNETETDWAAFALEIGKLILSLRSFAAQISLNPYRVYIIL